MNTRNEVVTVLILALFYFIALAINGFPNREPMFEMADYVGLAILFGMGVVTLFCISTKVWDDPSREKEMRRQIELEKQKTQKLDDDESHDWIMK